MSTRRALLAAVSALLLSACGSRPAAPSGRGQVGAGTVEGGTVGAGTVGLNLVGILTRDLQASLAFYRRLGLDIPAAVTGHDFRLRAGDGHVLFWEDSIAVHAFDPDWAPPTPGNRTTALEFGFATAADLDVTYAALTEAGAPTYRAPFALTSDVYYAIVLDPDGNQISLRHSATG